jgi:hypothetical protein
VVGFYADYVGPVREFKEAILHTDDGGNTWSFQHQGSEAGRYLYGLHLVDAQHGWAVGSEGTVYRTTDGSTWEVQGSVTGQALLGVHFADTEHGWAVGSAGTIIYSETGGAQPTPTPTLIPTPTSTPVPTPTPTPYPEPIAFGIPQWQENGLPVAVFTKTQYGPMMVSDDAGGAILSWKDFRHTPGGLYLYAQRVSSDGQLLWGTDGVSVSGSMGQNWDTHPMVSDGAGGAIVVWLDYQDISDPDDDQLYAQRLDANGQPLWTPGGVPLSTGNNYVYWLRTTSDSQGGVITVWEDDRNEEHVPDIYAQRLDANGNQLWSGNDVAVCTAADMQIRPELTDDGAGGAIIAWIDDRNEDISGPASLGDIYAQRVSASGTPLWTTDGVTVCTAINGQYFPRLVPDGSGGAIIAWNDSRTGGDYGHQDMYVQRVDANGVAQWTADGVMLCDAVNDQWDHSLVSDGAGGAILFWEDYRRGRSDIYAQRVGADGTPLWRSNGIPAGDHPAGQFYPLVVPDGAGGALAAWMSGGSLYAQRVTRDGVIFWEPGLGSFVGGWAVRPQPGHRIAVASSDGGIIVAWTDDHNGDDDVYVQKVLEFNPDLWLTKTPHAVTVDPSEPITYSLAYINTMTGTIAVSASITDDVPAFTSFIACAGGESCGPAGDVVVWYLGDVPTRSAGIVTLTLWLSDTAPPGTLITNTAVFSSPAASGPAVTTAEVYVGWPFDVYLPLVLRNYEP